MTKPPGQRHRQDGGCQATCSLHFFLEDSQCQPVRPSPRPTLTDGWLLHPVVEVAGAEWEVYLSRGAGETWRDQLAANTRQKKKKLLEIEADDDARLITRPNLC